jgi:hypothetical protein
MKVSTRAVKDLAKEAGFHEEIIERNIDELIAFTFRIASREQKWCADKVRAWYFDSSLNKPQLFELFVEDHDIV